MRASGAASPFPSPSRPLPTMPPRAVPITDANRARARARSAAAGHSDRFRGHPGVSDRLYDDEESAFLRAAEAYRCDRHLPFLTAADYLAVLKGLGYRRGDGPGAPAPDPARLD
jgi:hypothetical protein